MNSFCLQYADCNSQIKFIQNKLPVNIAVGYWMSPNFLWQSGEGSSKPELLDTRHETKILHPEEDPKLTTPNQVSFGYTLTQSDHGR